MNKFWNMSASLSDDSILNMYVYGDIVTDSSWFWGSEDDVVTREFIKDLNKHPNAKRINVYINSGGGEVFAAVEIAQQLKRHKAEVHTYVEGMCASAATLIAMAGDVRHMTISGLYMIHLPSSSVRGNKHNFAKGIEVLEKVEDIIRLTYKNKTNLTDEELSQMLDHETWLTAEEAYKYGFVTDIEEGTDEIDALIKEVQNDVVAMNGVEFTIAAYADQEQLRAKLTEIQTKNKGGIIMDFQALLDSLPAEKCAVVENALKEQVTNKTAELTTQVTNLTEQVTNLTEQLTSTQENITNTQNALITAQERATKAETALEQVKDQGEDEDIKFLNSLPDNARQAVLDARKVATAAQEALDKANETSAFATFQDKVKTYDNLPLQDEHVKALYNMSKACPTDFAAVEKLFNSANAAMGNNFEQQGQDGDGTGAPTNAYETIEKLIQDKRIANPAMDYNEAFATVVSENPDLYDRYRDGE